MQSVALAMNSQPRGHYSSGVACDWGIVKSLAGWSVILSKGYFVDQGKWADKNLLAEMTDYVARKVRID